MEIKAETIEKSRFRRICVFCGSSQGKKSSYQDAAIDLGNELVSRNIDIVYGGGSIGLMGLVSQAIHDGGRHVIGYNYGALINCGISSQTKVQLLQRLYRLVVLRNQWQSWILSRVRTPLPKFRLMPLLLTSRISIFKIRFLVSLILL